MKVARPGINLLLAAAISSTALVAAAAAADEGFGPAHPAFAAEHHLSSHASPVQWIKVPPFDGGAEEARSALEDIRNNSGNARVFVFDLRGSTGSNAVIAESIVEFAAAVSGNTQDARFAVVTDGRCDESCHAVVLRLTGTHGALHVGQAYAAPSGMIEPQTPYDGPWETGVVQAFTLGAMGLMPGDAAAWRAAFLSDLDFLHQTIVENHPIAVDTENPEGMAYVERGYAEARALADQVTDEGGYVYGIRFYVNRFYEPHTVTSLDFPGTSLEWPGFIVAMRGGKPTVVDVEDGEAGLPPLGAVIVSCDGQSVANLVADRIFPFQFNPGRHAERVRAVSRLFVKTINPFRLAISSCTDDAGNIYTMTWRTTDNAYFRRLRLALFGEPTMRGITESDDGLVWIALRSFDTGASNAGELNAIIAEIEAKAARWRDTKRAIILDMRGNGGGSSSWGDRVFRAIWGERPPSDEPRTAVDWRPSPGNLAHFEAHWQIMQERMNPTDEERAWMMEVLDLLRTGIAEGKTLVRQGNPDPEPGGGLTRLRPRGTSPFHAKIIFLNDSACGSACGDFADLVLQEPGVIHAGFYTAGDAIYMDGRTVTLPSGLGNFFFAQKVYRGRARGNLEEYTPDWLYEGVWRDEDISAWILAKLDAMAH